MILTFPEEIAFLMAAKSMKMASTTLPCDQRLAQ
jgi:hypothetical protein